MDLFNFWKPKNILRLNYLLINGCFFLLVISTFVLLDLSSFYMDGDYQQGENAKIIYVHVPSAWISMLMYVLLFLSSVVYVIWRHPYIYFFSKGCSITGLLFTLVTLVTGSLWGMPTWGAFWVWDARLTSVFVLFLLYVGHLYLCYKDGAASSFKEVRSSVLAILGSINIPIIKFSVDWWNSLHQSSSVSLSLSSSNFDTGMLIILTTHLFYFTLFAVMIVLVLFRTYLIEYRILSMNKA